MNKNEHVLQLISSTPNITYIGIANSFYYDIYSAFYLKISNKQITLMNYIQELNMFFQYRLKTFRFGSASWDQRGYFILSHSLFCTNVSKYNITTNFIRTHHKIVNEIHKFGYYCNPTASSMENFNALCEDFKTYYPFRENINVISGKLRYGFKFLAIKEYLKK